MTPPDPRALMRALMAQAQDLLTRFSWRQWRADGGICAYQPADLIEKLASALASALDRVAGAAKERNDTIAALRNVCGKHGDNDWSDNLHLADIVDKHLGRHLECIDALTAPVDDVREREIEERLAKATPGPWAVYLDSLVAGLVVEPRRVTGDWIAELSIEREDATDEGSDQADADGVFIAAARSDVPYLLARVRALTAEVETAKAERDEAGDQAKFWYDKLPTEETD